MQENNLKGLWIPYEILTREIYNYIIFTNDREKILYNKKRFWI